MGFRIITYEAFEPSDIDGLKAWYDASQENLSDGASVSQVLDKSGNEAHLFQMTSASQPTLQTNELNSKSVYSFDGVDDFLNFSAPIDQPVTSNPSLNSVDVSHSGTYVAVMNGSTSPYFFIYKKDNNVWRRLSNPASLPTGNGNGCSWSSDDQYLAIAHATAPRIAIYKRSDDTFTKQSDPSTVPNGTTLKAHFSQNDYYLALAGAQTNLNTVYKINKSTDPWTFTAITNPFLTAIGGTQSNIIEFSPNDTFVAVGSNGSPFLQIYSVDKNTDQFTKLNNPTTLPASTVQSISWLNETTLAVGIASNFVAIYTWDGTTFQQLTTLNSTSSGNAVKYSNDGNYLAIAISSNSMKIFKRTDTTYTDITISRSNFLGAGRGVGWDKFDNNVIFHHSNSPTIQIYQRTNDTFTNRNRLNIGRQIAGTTIFAIVKYPANNLSNFCIDESIGTSATSSRKYLSSQATTNTLQIQTRILDADSGATATSTATPSTFVCHMALMDYSNALIYQYINGSLDGTGGTSGLTAGNSSNTDTRVINIGRSLSATGYLNGMIAEILYYNRKLTNSEINKINKYLSIKWGLTIASL